MKLRVNRQNGDGIAVIVYGVTLMIVFTFLAINILNGKIIENGYNSLRDSIMSATTGSVIHLMTSVDSYKEQEQDTKKQNTSEESTPTRLNYDLYLQLALGYIINRNPDPGNIANPQEDNKVVQSGNINNFLKLDHKKVVESTLALLEDSVIRGKGNANTPLNIRGEAATKHFKILMIFIEPHYDNSTYQKGFDIIVYGNEKGSEVGTIYPITVTVDDATDMGDVYEAIELQINNIVNSGTPVYGGTTDAYKIPYHISVKLLEGHSTRDEMVRNMETKPYYVVVVKDFALPTLFRNTYTDVNAKSNIFRSAFESLSGDGHLKTPIVALNSAKIERKLGGSDR